ncbi:TPA: hypothetical protein O8T86_004017 [Enterobacter asburiae]|uniref:hypothetical protein n=1 Tax=Enterobacter asburiae TaxID=61645 RepID=UPI001F45C8B5|nr:hypothetical protein [Enterobacter asburiae]MCF1340529.1 hypothetical protein [Enterobacter asburiae]MCQ4338908.1 hypothetical protein [Enterobacter asburiae]HDC4533282.1 hypothetical protein [Enterobacter asburiae]HDC4565124.1 hypothetical protein [Enterobacter asburiae]
MFAETTAALSAAKQAYDLLKIIQDGRDAALVSDAVSDLRQKITDLQMLNVELASLYHAEKELVMQLSEEKSKKEKFIQYANNYSIHKTEAGSTVYRFKDALNGSNEPHYICAHCYQNEKISILQPSTKIARIFNHSYINAYCPSCSAEFVMHEVPSHEEMRTTVYEFKLS